MKNDMNNGVLKKYLNDIKNTSPISIKDEQALFRLISKNNKAAREKLISANMRFVLKVALQYRGCSIPLQDLVSEGSMGLIRAIESFDYSRGLKFISYAVWWIKAYINRAVSEQSGIIRLPANQHLKVKQAVREVDDTSELSSEISSLLQILNQSYSLDDPINQNNDKSFSEIIADNTQYNPETKAEVEKIKHVAEDIINQLPLREANVIRCLFGLDENSAKNLREVGEELNISHERVRQLRDQALRRIRKTMDKLDLKDRFNSYLSARESINEI